MEVDKQLKFKSHKRMQVEFISNNVDVMTHDCLFSGALALDDGAIHVNTPHGIGKNIFSTKSEIVSVIQ